MSETDNAARPYDFVAAAGRLVRRGYLELIINEPFDPEPEASNVAQVEVLRYNPFRHRAPVEEAYAYESRIPGDLSAAQRTCLAVHLFTYLTVSLGVDVFAPSLEEYAEQLQTFGKYVEHFDGQQVLA
ncbi:MAG: hypothetical protein WAJ85_13590 [Candidatus Baltobacteraceae bacterium]